MSRKITATRLDALTMDEVDGIQKVTQIERRNYARKAGMESTRKHSGAAVPSDEWVDSQFSYLGSGPGDEPHKFVKEAIKQQIGIEHDQIPDDYFKTPVPKHEKITIRSLRDLVALLDLDSANQHFKQMTDQGMPASWYGDMMDGGDSDGSGESDGNDDSDGGGLQGEEEKTDDVAHSEQRARSFSAPLAIAPGPDPMTAEFRPVRIECDRCRATVEVNTELSVELLLAKPCCWCKERGWCSVEENPN
jgi:hypothetical protein